MPYSVFKESRQQQWDRKSLWIRTVSRSTCPQQQTKPLAAISGRGPRYRMTHLSEILGLIRVECSSHGVRREKKNKRIYGDKEREREREEEGRLVECQSLRSGDCRHLDLMDRHNTRSSISVSISGHALDPDVTEIIPYCRLK